MSPGGLLAVNTPSNIMLEELTWTDVAEALERGVQRAVFAVGAVEQHGPHLPLLVDAAIGTDLARRVAAKLGDALVAPTIRIGCSEHHMRFAGTLSVREETLRAVVQDVAVSLARHGFREIIIIPSHGGNFRPVHDMLPTVREAVTRSGADGDPAKVWAFVDLAGLVTTWKRAIEEAGGPAERVGGHADIAESSILQILTPALVHEERAEAGHQGEISNEAFARVIADGLHTVTPNGILGDARGMSPDLGRACQEAVSSLIVDSYNDYLASLPKDPGGA